MKYTASSERYKSIPYVRTGKSGLKLPIVSLGLWHNFGGVDKIENMTKILHRAFDRGITHFDLANNYGPPPGSAEINFGKIFKKDFRAHRDELIISTKAGYHMWQGPYGDWGSRKYMLSSLDQSLERMGLPYVDIFYSHRFDPETPLEETMGALDSAVKSGKALYAGISNYPPAETDKACAILKSLGTPCLIHQAAYSMMNRKPEEGLIEAVGRNGIGLIAFSPLAQGQLTDKYLKGIPKNSRAGKKGTFLKAETITEDKLKVIRALNELAVSRGQTLARMALAWVLRDARVTSVLIGASSAAQVDDSLACIEKREFSNDEISKIDAILKG
ncbi:MAG: aldo/keto reductase [Spirochaetia bacterium]|nr:aldo/keto reductase [Spirochaetia bacterium]